MRGVPVGHATLPDPHTSPLPRRPRISLTTNCVGDKCIVALTPLAANVPSLGQKVPSFNFKSIS